MKPVPVWNGKTADGKPFVPPADLSVYTIRQIHAGLLIPNEETILRMSRQLLKLLGEKNPDLI